jgi:DNA replication protein DnaC
VVVRRLFITAHTRLLWLTAALLDRFTHHCTIIEMNGESYRFRESTKAAGGRQPATVKASKA